MQIRKGAALFWCNGAGRSWTIAGDAKTSLKEAYSALRPVGRGASGREVSRRLERGHAAIRRQHGARDEGGGVAQQKNRGLGNLAWFSEPA
jgi:hypothetical protein